MNKCAEIFPSLYPPQPGKRLALFVHSGQPSPEFFGDIIRLLENPSMVGNYAFGLISIEDFQNPKELNRRFHNRDIHAIQIDKDIVPEDTKDEFIKNCRQRESTRSSTIIFLRTPNSKD